MAGSVIPLVDLSQAPEDIQRAAQAHLDKGYRMTNEKRTLLHNAVAFEALEGMSYAVSAEMKKFTTHRAANLFQYAISLENDCLVCSTYYRKAMADLGLDSLEESQFTPEEKLLVEYARAIVRNHKFIPDDLLQRLLDRFGEEGVVVITTMAMFMIGNNYFNDILRVQSEFLTPASETN
jgi:alkylhydroperoxidase family enzyme